MTLAIPSDRTVRLAQDGSYEGTPDGYESVRFAKIGMTVSLWDIDRVVGNRGNDVVTFGGASTQRPSKVNLGSGYDVLHLGGGQDYVLKLSGVETITAEPDSSLTIVGGARFTTDGSFSIATDDSSRGVLRVEFTDIADDITLSLGTGKHVISFGPGFDFTEDQDGRLVVSRSGHELTFAGVDGANELITIVEDGVRHTYAEMLSARSEGSGPTVTEFINDHADGVLSDDDRVVNYTVRFSEPVSGVSAEDLVIYGGGLTSGPDLAADGLSITFAVEAPLGSADEIYVYVADTITDLDGHPLEPAQDRVRVDLVPPVLLSLSTDFRYSPATNADSVEFRGQFTKFVTQLSAEDFVLSGTTATITSIESTQGSRFGELTVTVSGGDLAELTGTITLAFAQGQDVTDLYGRPLADMNLDMTVSVQMDNDPPLVEVTGVTSLVSWGYPPGFGIVGSGINESGRFDSATFDWSKLWIAVDDGGPNITFSAGDSLQTVYATGFIGIILTESKLSEIHDRVDGSADRFVIEEGFWSDRAGNVQLVGGGFDTPADMF
jgi:hypothetical protein